MGVVRLTSIFGNTSRYKKMGSMLLNMLEPPTTIYNLKHMRRSMLKGFSTCSEIKNQQPQLSSWAKSIKIPPLALAQDLEKVAKLPREKLGALGCPGDP